MNTEQLAAEMLLEKGVPVPVKVPLLLRVLGIKTAKMFAPSLGNRVRISRLYIKMNIPEEQLTETTQLVAETLLEKHAYTHCRIVAMAMYKGWLFPILFNHITALWLKWYGDDKKIMALAELLLLLSGAAVFMSTTRYIRAMKITAPNLGQKEPKRS